MAQVCGGGTSHRAHWVETDSGLTCLKCHLPVGDGEGSSREPLARAQWSNHAYDTAGNWLIVIWCLAGIAVFFAFVLVGSAGRFNDDGASGFSVANGFLAAIVTFIVWVPWIGVFTVLRAGYAPR